MGRQQKGLEITACLMYHLGKAPSVEKLILFTYEEPERHCSHHPQMPLCRVMHGNEQSFALGWRDPAVP